ncbi:MAG: 4-vinyl reductase [Lachnospiraceae bacterium]|jgi:predicted hydrocarbon binding protein|nr:4-vinyl reductase [Lachnospiraceae bacterium]MDD3617546.1 4-vinyl reductase [Lachnospiraceae bacterium]
MANIFEENSHRNFTWEKLGDIRKGRQNLGEEVPVILYRLMEYTINDVLSKEMGAEKANDIFRKAGYLAGTEFTRNVMDTTLGLDEFVASLQQTLIDLKMGILRIEQYDENTGEFTLTVGEDLDCSGLPLSNEVVCNYDEGLLQGVMETYTGKDYQVREIDCWATGDRVCRFRGNVLEHSKTDSNCGIH